MGNVSAAEDFLPAPGRVSVHVRTSRLAGADRDLPLTGSLGDHHSAARSGRSGNRRISALEAQEGHQTLRGEDR